MDKSNEQIFSERFYEWSLKDFEREVLESFPLLKTITDGAVETVLNMMSEKSEEERLFFARTLVRRFSVQIFGHLRLPIDPLDRKEKILADEYLARSQKEWKFEVSKVRKSKIRKTIHQDLNEFFKEKADAIPGGSDRYITPIGPWHLYTDVDTGGRQNGFCYSQSLLYLEDRNQNLFSHTSITSWMGITSTTRWRVLTEEEIQPAVESLKKVCAHFMNALPGLIKDLSPLRASEPKD